MGERVRLLKTIKRHGQYFKPGKTIPIDEFDADEGERLEKLGVLEIIGDRRQKAKDNKGK